MSSVVERFLKYVSFDTRAVEDSSSVPSSSGQMELAREVAKEMEALGMVDISVDDHAYVMGTFPGNVKKERVLAVGFIAHLDTSYEVTGTNAKPRIVSYEGGDIVLNEEQNILLSPQDFPELEHYKGHDLIVTDGTTLLGVDDKGGMAQIMAAVEYLKDHPHIQHGPVKVCFTPDEEIGHQAKLLDLKKFGANFAYTVDGGPLGELNFETFNAAKAVITIYGRSVHPGTAKDKMINAALIGTEFAGMFPFDETPAKTEKYEGFYHLVSFQGNVEKTVLQYIIRDHDWQRFQDRKQRVADVAQSFQEKYGTHVLECKIEDQYFNMAEKIKDAMHIVETAKQAMKDAGIEPRIVPVRGGTDGSSLSFRGLLTPNLFTGGHNYHGRFEYVPIFALEKGVEVIVNIIKLYGTRSA
ncbi:MULTISPECIES: peptidase T [Aminobacterium]|jgi:tripeptide aminopeptidase|uniref:peptidase T n=1 Tax=Aminobacterium TaxID=81466 RepID=UPI0004654875|nr:MULTISPECIES: peptidase T [Aminobacterium]